MLIWNRLLICVDYTSICSIDPCLPNSLLYTSSLHFLLNEPQTHNRAEIPVLQLPCIIQVYTAIVNWTHKSTQKKHPLPLTESTSHNPLYSTHVAVQWSVDPQGIAQTIYRHFFLNDNIHNTSHLFLSDVYTDAICHGYALFDIPYSIFHRISLSSDSFGFFSLSHPSSQIFIRKNFTFLIRKTPYE